MKINKIIFIMAITFVLSITSVVYTNVFAINGPLSNYAYINLYDAETGMGTTQIFDGANSSTSVENISYDKDTNTLTLNNFVSEQGIGINELGDNFKIDIKGTCSIAGLYGYCSSITLMGDGVLTINEAKNTDYAVVLYAEMADGTFTVEKTVTLNLYGLNGLIQISGTKVSSKANIINLKNGQNILDSINQEELTQAPTFSGVILTKGYETSYTLYEKDGKYYGLNGRYMSNEQIVYDTVSDIYFLDPTSSTSAFNTSFDDEEAIADAGYTKVDREDKITISYSAQQSSWLTCSEDSNHNSYVVWRYYDSLKGENLTGAFDISENTVTLSDNIEYKIITLNEEVDPEILQEAEGEPIGIFDYTLNGNSLNVEAVIEEANNEEEKTEEAENTDSDVKEEEKTEETENTDSDVKEEEKTEETENTNSDVKEEEKTEETENTDSDVKEEEKTEETENTNSDVKEEETLVEAEEAKEETLAVANEVKKLVESVLEGNTVEGISEELATEIKEAVNSGKNVTLEVSMPVVTKDAVSEDAEKVQEKISNNENVAAYFDINLFIKVENESKGKVTKLNDKVKITVEIPKDIPEVKEGYTRTYKVVRVHDGVAEILPTTVSGTSASFETDSFSTYALIYEDTLVSSYPQTGDNLVITVSLLLATTILLTVVYKIKKV